MNRAGTQRCLECKGALDWGEEFVSCQSCLARWPIVDGIPCYRSAPYFGEVPLEQVKEFVKLAGGTHWLEAAKKTFREANPEQYDYIVDLNRASWLHALPLNFEGRALDVGAGFGAITHALAHHFADVTAIEPVAERIQFVRLRIDQEKLDNVELIQTTITAMPFADNTFDLVILNGILEWIGVWVPDDNVRNAQVEILRRIRGLLKPGGKLVLGIENRIGWDSFLGRVDHPGTRFTSLMPRFLASLYVKLVRPRFHRTTIDHSRGYRTYTYSYSGYRRLLTEAGFDCNELWFPPNGYSAPHVLLRADARNQVIAYFYHSLRHANWMRGFSLSGVVKYWLLISTRLMFWLLPDLLIVAKATNKAEGAKHATASIAPLLTEATRQWAESVPGSKSNGNSPNVRALFCNPHANKSTLIIGSHEHGPTAVAKVTNISRAGSELVVCGQRILKCLNDLFESSAGAVLQSTPQSLGKVQVGNTLGCLEAVARGKFLESIACSGGFFRDQKRIAKHMSAVATWIGEAQPYLDQLGRNEQDWLPSYGGENDPLYSPGDSTQFILDVNGCVQHGDFIPANIFVDEDTERLCVIDWDQCGNGYPPLFDWFCLVSSLYYTQAQVRRLPGGQTVDDRSFLDTFFARNWFSKLVLEQSLEICKRLALDEKKLSQYFQGYLVFRWNQFRKAMEYRPVQPIQRQCLDNYRYFMLHREASIFKP